MMPKRKKRRSWAGWIAVGEFGVRGKVIYPSRRMASVHGEPVRVEMFETFEHEHAEYSGRLPILRPVLR